MKNRQNVEDEINNSFKSSISLLRILCALMVMIYHAEGAKWFLGISGIFNDILFKRLWPVTFGPFMCLSLFLLTRKLSKLQEINVKSIICKRFLRIYPTYIFISFLGIFVLPHFWGLSRFPFPSGNVFELFMLSIFGLPHLIQVFFGEILFINIFWFLGIQEFLYFITVLSFSKFKKKMKYFSLFFLTAIVILRFYKFEIFNLLESLGLGFHSIKYLKRLEEIVPLEYGLIAIFLGLQQPKMVKHFKGYIFILIALIFSSLCIQHERLFFTHAYFGLLISLLVYNLSLIKWHAPKVDFIASYTYAFYSVHSIFIVILFDTIFNAKEFSLLSNLWFYLMLIWISCLASYLIKKLFK